MSLSEEIEALRDLILIETKKIDGEVIGMHKLIIADKNEISQKLKGIRSDSLSMSAHKSSNEVVQKGRNNIIESIKFITGLITDKTSDKSPFRKRALRSLSKIKNYTRKIVYDEEIVFELVDKKEEAA